MGKLRFELKKKTMSPERYKEVLTLLTEAGTMAGTSHLFYDLDGHEAPNTVRKEILYVADQEKIEISVRRVRGAHTLQFVFGHAEPSKRKRMSAAEARKRIVEVLITDGKPMKKAEILERSGISPGTWNPRINELLEMGKVHREGERRDTVYALSS